MPVPVPTLDEVIRAACGHFDLEPALIFDDVRHADVVYKRRVAMWVCYKELGEGYCASASEIGRAFHRDHTTVLTAMERVRDAVTNESTIDRQLRNDIARVRVRAFEIAAHRVKSLVINDPIEGPLATREAVEAWWSGLRPEQQRMFSEHDKAQLLRLLGC